MKRLVLLLLLLSATSFAQHLVKQPTFDAIANEFSGERAQEHIRAIVQYHRIQGSPMMADVAASVVLPRLKSANIESSLDQYPSDGKIKYNTYVSPMGWEMRGGELWIDSITGDPSFRPLRLCRYADVPMCVATYSKGGDWTGELVDVGRGISDKDYEGKDVRGKVALASAYAANVVRAAVIKRGAIGVVIYPDLADRPEHPDMIRYNGIWPTAEELDKTSGGFMISLNQYASLKQWMSQGPVRVHGRIDAKLSPFKLTNVHAYIRGTQHPEQEVLISAHLDHPKWSANDNASGSAALIEMARTLKSLIDSKKIAAPARTIHFMWVPEYNGTLAYLASHKEARRCGDWDDPRGLDKWDPAKRQPCIVANINMDMVGEDTVKTNGRFYFTRTPASVPSFLDTVLEDALEQTRAARLYAAAGTHNYWPTDITPLVLGSDHEPFLGLGIPASMFGHDPDWTHHTSEDTVDKTDASELLRVGVMATAAAHWMSAATDNDWSSLAQRAATANATRLSLLAYDRATPIDPSRIDAISKTLNDQMAVPAAPSRPRTGSGYHRLVTVPIDTPEIFADLSPEDRKWWNQQDARFAPPPGVLLPTTPTLDLLLWETINLLDGHRSSLQLAEILNAEFASDLDAPWVDRLLSLLEKKKLVSK
jgi:aminopeptidase YwaD